VWCDPQSEGERLPFPNSPFQLAVSSGEPSTSVSQVDGWTKLLKDEKVKYGKGAQVDVNTLIAGDTLTIRPEIFDEFGNPTVVQEGQLQIQHQLPNETKTLLKYTQQVRGGTTQYDIKHDTSVSGDHEIHIMLGETPIKGSPVTFTVLPDKPDPERCKLFAPTDGLLLLDQPYASLLRTYDKYGNACISGGHKFGTRLQLVKQSMHDQTALVPQNHSIETDDLQDGTYHINVSLSFNCAVKLFVNMDKNLPGAAGELPPVNLNFVKSESDMLSQSDMTDGASPLGLRPSGFADGSPKVGQASIGGVDVQDATDADEATATRSSNPFLTDSAALAAGSLRAISATGSTGSQRGGGTSRRSSGMSPKVSAKGSPQGTPKGR